MNNDSNTRTAVVFIPLTQGKVTVIDFDDFEKVRGHKWYAKLNRRMWYAVRSGKSVEGKQPFIQMHRVISGAEVGELTDHKDGDGLNNRRYNLRIANHFQNARNQKHKRIGTSSQFKGVSYRKDSDAWRAYIHAKGNRKWLGLFPGEVDAARAYDNAARKYFGEFAACNFPQKG